MVWSLTPARHGLDCACLALPRIATVQCCSAHAMVFSKHSTFLWHIFIPPRELGREEKGDLGAIFSALYAHMYIIHILQ